MKVGTYTPIPDSEVPEIRQAPWAPKVLKGIYEFLTRLGKALAKGLDFESNFNATLWEGSLNHGVEVTIRTGITGKPAGVVPVGEGVYVPFIVWQPKDETIVLTAWFYRPPDFVSAPSAAQPVRLLIFGRA